MNEKAKSFVKISGLSALFLVAVCTGKNVIADSNKYDYIITESATSGFGATRDWVSDAAPDTKTLPDNSSFTFINKATGKKMTFKWQVATIKRVPDPDYVPESQ